MHSCNSILLIRPIQHGTRAELSSNRGHACRRNKIMQLIGNRIRFLAALAVCLLLYELHLNNFALIFLLRYDIYTHALHIQQVPRWNPRNYTKRFFKKAPLTERSRLIITALCAVSKVCVRQETIKSNQQTSAANNNHVAWQIDISGRSRSFCDYFLSVHVNKFTPSQVMKSMDGWMDGSSQAAQDLNCHLNNNNNNNSNIWARDGSKSCSINVYLQRFLSLAVVVW